MKIFSHSLPVRARQLLKAPYTERYVRCCERTAVSHRLLLDLEKIQTFISGGQQICLSGVSFSNSKILYMDFTWHCRGFDLVAVK